MDVILLERVVNLGNLGDVVKVRPGYARNFLIPTGKARRATEKALAEFEGRRAELEQVQAEKLAGAQARAEKLEGFGVTVSRKAGVDGRLFGSVTHYDVIEALAAQGMQVDKAEIQMPQGALKQVGDYPLVLRLHTDVEATITVTVSAE